MIRRSTLSVCAITIFFLAGVVKAGEVPTGHGIDGSAQALVKSTSVKVAPSQGVLDSGLNQVVKAQLPLETARELGFKTRGNQIQVVLATTEGVSSEIVTWLVESGATGVLSAGNLVEAFVSVDLLYSIDLDERIHAVRKPTYLLPDPEPEPNAGVKAGTKTTEGLAAMNANAWQNAGYSGEGMKVAIIDAGFEGYPSLLGSDLPDASHVFYYDFSGMGMENSPHGAACAEIVHDLVPGATEMHIYTATTDVEVANAIATAQGQGIDVVSISLGTLIWGPGNGTGIIANAINTYTSAGGLVAVSAGNFRDGHWQGSWSDPESNGYLNFSSTVEVDYLTVDGTNPADIPAGTELSVQLVWNQWSSPTTDLDLYLFHWNSGTEQWEQVESSAELQNGSSGQLPIEAISFTTTEAGAYGVVVQYYSGPKNVDIEVLVRPETLPLVARVANGSISVPGDTAAAISVAALDVTSPYALESYSSRGPTNGPGGSLTGGSIKPDLSGYANVSTASYGTRGFNGTSAACPHVAGAAALVWSAHPSWTNSQVRSFLESNAQDKGPSGKDNDYGYGRLYLGSPPSTCSYSISPASRSHSADGGSGTVAVSTSSGCSWTASSNTGWLSVTGGSSGSGNGTVSYSVTSSSSSASRSGTLTIAGKTFTVTQSGASSCTYSISPTSRSHAANGGSGTVAVSTSSSCSWTASSNTGWLSVTGGSSGSGNGTVSYSVTSNSSSSSRTGTLTIAGKTFTVTQTGQGSPPPSGGFTAYAVIARTTGANNSVWLSSLSISNVSPDQATATLTYQYRSDASIVRNVTIQPMGMVEWADTAADLFNLVGKSSGVVTIQANHAVLVAVRTFNSSADGTFGQSLPGVSSSESINNAQFGIINPVRRTSAFRTNIGIINTGTVNCTALVYFVNRSGNSVGRVLTVNLVPGGWKQINEAIAEAGISSLTGGYAVIQLETAGARVWAYGTVIDNSSGDPTALRMAIVE